MLRNEFTIEERHVGKKVFRAFGKRWRLGFTIRPEDVGRRVYRKANGEIAFEDLRVTSEAYPCIHAICSSLNLNPVQHVMHRKYAIGNPEDEYEVTPWFVRIIDLERWCSRNFGAYFPQSRMVQ
jgi:hypothetical protein